ncbi:MAG: hypothetical protein WCI49_06715 [Ferruginibacter sp.]
MRYILTITAVLLLFSACKKDKFTTVPQISFKSVDPNFYQQGLTPDASLPVITVNVTDAEGDLGFITGKDTSFIFFKNLRTNKLDSVELPNIKQAATKNFQGDVAVNMKQFLGVPNNSKKDTIFYEIYMKDFAKNKSNVIRTEKPVYYYP